MGTTGDTTTSGGTTTGPTAGAGSAGAPAPDLAALSESALGWHRIQLAVLGFIGFCGILWEGDAATPSVVQYAGLVLIVTAFVLAVVSILVVGRVAHPVGGPGAGVAVASDTAARRTRRLRGGIWGTYLAVALLALATLSAWLPPGVGGSGDGQAGMATAAGEDAVVVVDVDARAWCGEVVGEAEGAVRLRTTEGMEDVARDRIVVLHPVGAC